MTKKFEELNDSQWAAISLFFNMRRKRKHSLRVIVNALLYMVRTGCQWRNLPSSYPSWRAVNYYFEQWKRNGTLQRINDTLNQLDRQQQGKEAFPSLMCIDSQSVKLTPMISGFEFERASKPESAKGFVPIAKRWVVERTIAWTNFFRRIVKDYEYTVLSSESWVLLANTTIVLQRLFPNSE
jgi:transposase